MTANFNLVLPLMIGSGLAYLLSDKISSGSIYDRLLAFQGIHLNVAPSEAHPWANLIAEDLMQRRVETLSATMTVPEALEAFFAIAPSGLSRITPGQVGGHCHPNRSGRQNPVSIWPIAAARYHDP